jgi:hypothetical protein
VIMSYPAMKSSHRTSRTSDRRPAVWLSSFPAGSSARFHVPLIELRQLREAKPSFLGASTDPVPAIG